VVKTLPLALTVSKGEKKMISITLEEIVEKAEKARVNGEDEGFEINKKILKLFQSLRILMNSYRMEKPLTGFIGMLKMLLKVDGLKLKNIL